MPAHALLAERFHVFCVVSICHDTATDYGESIAWVAKTTVCRELICGPSAACRTDNRANSFGNSAI